MFEFKFADIGEGVHEGEILKWHVQPGNPVKRDQLVVEVMTEKVNVEIAAPVAGLLKAQNFKEGQVIKVGQILFVIDESAGSSSSTSVAPSKPQKSDAPSKPEEKDDSLFVASERVKRQRVEDKTIPKVASRQVTPVPAAAPTIMNENPLAAPSVRREAREKNIDLRFVSGSGPGGRIQKEDLDLFAGGMPSVSATDDKVKITTTPSITPGSEQRIPIRGIRKSIAERMAKSKRTAAHFSYFDEFDMSSLESLKDAAREKAETKGSAGAKVTYLPFIMKAVVRALREHPELNASVDDEKEEIIVKGYYNIGFATDTPNGLMVPIIKNVDRKNIWELSSEIQDLAQRARTGKLKLDEVTGGTFTLTNVGPIGGLMSTPIINYPEIAIIGIHQGKLRPVVIEDNGRPEIAIRKMMYLSISVDHRATDGANAARFLNAVIRYLESPALMVLDQI